MHDITEGGVLGAVWEAAKAIGKGIRIKKDSIPILDSTKEICKFFNIDPLKLISSGSMLIIAPDEKVNIIEERLNKEGINVSVIGEVVKEGIIMEKGGQIVEIGQPESDELYKVI